MELNHWVACHGNATSIIDQKECTYAKNMTYRYPIFMVFTGDALRFHFSNLTGVEDVCFQASVALSNQNGEIDVASSKSILLDGKQEIYIPKGKEVISDEVRIDIKAGSFISVSLYIPDYTCMNAGVLITGKLSKGYYSVGDQRNTAVLPVDATRNTNWFYFLNTIDIRTEDKNHAVVCYGDSITAQDWPDDLTLRLWEDGIRDVAIIRRAVSGTRILREYHCTTYAAYGLKGETRFPIEMNVTGATAVIIQHGINDIIHPVGTEMNIFRPMSDMPTCDDLAKGMENIYVKHARELGLKVYAGTLLPIEGWRTYAPFREEVRVAFNDWMRNSDLFDGVVDFDTAVCDPSRPSAFLNIYDSGDHLHPSSKGYEKMAQEVDIEYLK